MFGIARCGSILLFFLNAIWNEPPMAAVISVTEQSGSPFSKDIFEMDVPDDPQIKVLASKAVFFVFCKRDYFAGTLQFPRIVVRAKDSYWTLISDHLAEAISVDRWRPVGDDNIYIITTNNSWCPTEIFDGVSNFYTPLAAFRSSIPSFFKVILTYCFENPSCLASNRSVGGRLRDSQRLFHVASLIGSQSAETLGGSPEANCRYTENNREQGGYLLRCHIGRVDEFAIEDRLGIPTRNQA